MNLFLLYSLFSAFHPDPPFHLCDTAKLADNSPYRASLDNLLSSMPSDLAPNSKFYTTSKGSDSDRVYGLFMCYAYSPQDECQKCLQPSSLSQTIDKFCPYKYEAVVWEEVCLFHYSTQNFFGQLNVTGNIWLDNVNNVSDPEHLRSVANQTLHNLTVLAAFDPSFDMHSNGSAPFKGNDSLHAFVQCSQDLSPTDCSACLETAIKEILECCYFSRGARLLSRSCFLRYELYDFLTADSQTHQNSTTGKCLLFHSTVWTACVIVIVLKCIPILVFRVRQKN